jgi:hypothetical protein
LTLQEEGVEEEPELKSYLVLKHGGAVLASTSPRNPVVPAAAICSLVGHTPLFSSSSSRSHFASSRCFFWIEIEREIRKERATVGCIPYRIRYRSVIGNQY